MIPFIFGILAGYALAAIFTGIGYLAQNDALKVIDFTKFAHMAWLPKFTFLEAFNGFKDFANAGQFFTYFGAIAVAYVPVAFVVFAEHIADHKNLSSIIDRDLLNEPGLHRTLLGDGIGSFAGAFFGGCPNTTYGESVGTVAISGNASIRTIFTTAILAIVLSFLLPFSTFLSTIPSCVMGGVCIALYGFIAVSGLKMIQKVDLGDNRNLFVVSVILIAGVGGFTLNIVLGNSGTITITEVACALILGIIVNFVTHLGKNKEEPQPEAEQAEEQPKEGE
jgi:uracil permease